jgi:hypothetical protein
MPVDYIQYKFNITDANLYPDLKPEWEIRYRATEFFGINNLSELNRIKSFIQTIDSNTANYLKIASAFFTEGPMYDVYTISKRNIKIIFRDSELSKM